MIGKSILIKRNMLLIIVLLCSIINISRAQKITAFIDSTNILIGDHTRLTIKATVPKNTEFNFYTLVDSIIKPFEIVEVGKTDTLNINDEMHYIQHYTIIGFEIGKQYFPALNYSIDGQRLFTDSIPFNVQTIKLDSIPQLKPIKGPIQIPLTFKEVAKSLLWLLFLVIALALIYWIYIRYIKKEKFVPESTLLEPPHILALRRLKEIEDQKLWQQERIKEYYIQISDTIRVYIEHRFSIHALEQTTDELILRFKKIKTNTENKTNLKKLLELSDLAKFAKTTPMPDENVMCMDLAVNFIQETTQIKEANSKDVQHSLFKKRYAKNEYKFSEFMWNKLQKKIIIVHLLLLLILPVLFVLTTYTFGIVSMMIYVTNYGFVSLACYFVFLIISFFVTSNIVKGQTDRYSLIFTEKGIIERYRGKKDIFILFEQINTITENQVGILTIYTKDTALKMIINPLIEQRKEVKERLADIIPIEFA